jgi:mitofusin 1
MNKKALRDLLADSRLIALAGRYEGAAESASSSLISRLSGHAGRLGADRFVLPVAGIQGSGKSTLLNALAFDSPVLPIDADETTCVPVEIAWGETCQATVHYADGRVEQIPCSEDALGQVVHNEHNPGNRKQVSRVALTSNREMFRPGLVLVDLPGVGSLTQANRDTTERYLREAVGVIFMLRTVPPLTRSEATFVSLQWSALPTALFVQNQWNDETDEEAAAGRDHNVKVLRQIAEQARIELDGAPEIRLVNGFQALRAAFNANPQAMEASGARTFADVLEGFGEDWSARVAADVAGACESELRRLNDIVSAQLEETKLDRQAQSEQMSRAARAFAKQLDAIDERADKMREDARKFRRGVRERLHVWDEATRAGLRNRMRTKMRAGIVDGPHLTRAFNDEQSEATIDIFGDVQGKALELQDRLRADLLELDAWTANAPELRFTVEREASTRYENLGGRAGAVGGALAGLAYGAMLGGPIGAMVGGLFGGLAGQFAGQKAKEGVTYLRAQAAEGEVFAAIEQYVDATTAALNDIAADFCKRLDEVLDQWRASQTRDFESKREQSLSMLDRTSQEKAQAAATLEADLASIGTLLEQLAEVRA